ncbi:MAG: flippase-like domain-containing protein [Acidobacteria bacterium]|nr:flippase-like domain-containing protein [Acidobacteriota bacterium]
MRINLRTALVLLLTILLVALFLRHANLADVWREIRAARMDLLAATLIVTLTTYVVRAFRWQYLLRPIGPTRFSHAFEATVIGFAATFLLPARAGEFIRPYLLARWERLSATASFATIILERLFDLVTVLLLFALFFFLFEPDVAAVDPRVFRAVEAGGALAGAGAAVGLVLMFVLAGHPERLGRWALRVEHVVPPRIAHVFSRFVRTFAEGLGVMRQPAELVMALVLSVPLWLSIATGIWLVSRAFHITYDFSGSFLVMALLVVGVSVPTPGAVGGFHEAYRLAVTSFYAAPNDRAVGAAIVLHALSFIPVTLVGIFFMARSGLNLQGVRTLARVREGPAGDAGSNAGVARAPSAERTLPSFSAAPVDTEGSAS